MSTLTTHIKTEKLARTLSGVEGEGREPNTPTLRFKEFEGEWGKLKLGKLGIFKGGGTPSTDNDEFWEGDIPWISSSDVNQGDIANLNITRYLTEKAIAESATKIIPRNSVLFVSRVGVGKLAVSKKELCTSQDFANLIPAKDSSYFIAYYFIARNKLLHQYSQGTSIKGFTSGDLKSIPINLPSLPEQQKIASFLSAVDSKIQQLTQKKKLLEQYKKGVMQQLFKSPTSTTLSTGLERTIAKQYTGVSLRFKDENGNAYPDWEEKRLLEFCKFFSGGTPSSTNKDYYNGEIPFIGSGNIYDSEVFNFITKEAFNSSSAKLIEKGDLLYALYGANSGESAISKLEGAINQAILCIRTDKSIEYLNYVLVSNKDKIVSKYLQGGQGNLSAQIIKKLKYKFPCFEEQQKIAAFLSSIDQKIARAGEQITHTQGFKKGLLQKMFV
jgi:type I restriction enzyme S subunit